MEKGKYILKKLEELYPDSKTELQNWKTEFQFLLCIVLSSQTTDNQVNLVTKKLFEKYSDVKTFAGLEYSQLEKEIASVNYYRAKSRHIVELSKMLIEDFDSNVPKNVSDLIKLPGVGRKTANVYLNELFKLNQGIAVDTHVARVAQRLCLTEEKIPDKIAFDLEKVFCKDDWYKINSRFVLFGRYYCKARKPECSGCIFRDICCFVKL